MIIPDTSPWLVLAWMFVLCASLALSTLTITFVVYMIKAMIVLKPKPDDDEVNDAD